MFNSSFDSSARSGQNLSVVFILLLVFAGLVWFAMKNKPITPEDIKRAREYYHKCIEDYRNLRKDFDFFITNSEKQYLAELESEAHKTLLTDTVPSRIVGSAINLNKTYTFLLGKRLAFILFSTILTLLLVAIANQIQNERKQKKKKKSNVIVFQDKKIKKAINYTLKILKEYKCPASITYHGTDEKGLYTHTLKVAEKSIEILKKDVKDVSQIQIDFVYLLALLHDIGKIRVYDFRNTKKKLKTKDPFGTTPIEIEIGWKSTGLPIPSNTKIITSKILRECGFTTKEIEYVNMLLSEDDSVNKTEEMEAYFSIVKEADMTITKQELQEKADESIYEAVIKALKSLNINGITGTYYDAWLTENALFVIAWKLAEQVAIIMNATTEDLEDIINAERRGSHKLHPILPSIVGTLKQKEMIYESFTDASGKTVEGDDLCLFDVKFSGILFRGLLILKPDILPEETRKSVGIFNGKVELKQRVIKVFEELQSEQKSDSSKDNQKQEVNKKKQEKKKQKDEEWITE